MYIYMIYMYLCGKLRMNEQRVPARQAFFIELRNNSTNEMQNNHN